MNIKTILVTGASGKLGKALVPALVEAGYKVRVTQFQTPAKFRGASTVTGSISDSQFVRKAMKGIDAVCHLATCKEDRDRFIDVSVKGTFHLLEQAREQKTKQFLLASGDASIGIFYRPQPQPLDENAPLAAYPGYYAFSKAMEETMVNQYHLQYGMNTTILRASWIHAEDDTLAHMTLSKPDFGGPLWEEMATTKRQLSFFSKKKEGVGCLVHPGGSPFVRHIVAIDDVVQSFLLSLGNPVALGETFNIAAASAFSYDVLADYISKKLSAPVVPFVCREGFDFSIDINKAKSLLGYRPEFDLFRMVDEAIEFREKGKKRSALRYKG